MFRTVLLGAVLLAPSAVSAHDCSNEAWNALQVAYWMVMGTPLYPTFPTTDGFVAVQKSALPRDLADLLAAGMPEIVVPVTPIPIVAKDDE